MRAIAIDDEPPALKVIENFCTVTDFISLQKTFTKPAEAEKYLSKFPVDLMFLDIQMPSISGIDFYKSLQTDTMVIFTTAYSEYAVDGFNLNALDFLLKPFTYERFTQATRKAADYFHFKNNNQTVKDQYIFVRADYKLVKINVEEIMYIEGMDDYVKIHIENKKTVLSRMTMKAIGEMLPEGTFIRVHRSFIVAYKRIENVRNKVIYTGGIEIPIGGIYEEEFFKFFGK